MYILMIYAIAEVDGAIVHGICRVPEDPHSRLTLEAALAAGEGWATKKPDDIVMLVPFF